MQGCNGIDGSEKPWHKPDEDDPGLDYPPDAFLKSAHAWLPTWVEPDHIAWALHCALGMVAPPPIDRCLTVDCMGVHTYIVLQCM